MAATLLPNLPAKHTEFIPYLASNPSKSLTEMLEPYKRYDTKLRQTFAQAPDHHILDDPHLNVVPIYAGHEKKLTIRARQLDTETQEEKERYVMPLKDDERKPNGSMAITQDFNTFQQNFAIFSESALADLDFDNVVIAGSSVVTCLLPVPEKHKTSKRTLRHFYHEIIAPASDIDLFLYGLTEDEATRKIIQIEQKIKDSILTETTTIRTRNAITIASQYPIRHIQIVLRIYKSVSEILTGFDVDCSCAAYDGKQVYASPRAIVAYISQCNVVDLTRRSPSYENRLSKYSHRGFEVHWPLLDRSRIDPTIFERNFARTVGLARLLVLEKLPSSTDRDSYMDQRRRERGRPEINRYNRYARYMNGNIKDQWEDEVAEWVDQEDVSDYHTFQIPYGVKFHAKKIEKLLYTKDLLLNAEWNKPDNREVNLHRHPAFFGYAEDVMHDCCGYCPKPSTYEEDVVAESESKIYVSGAISFIKDDPGRQAIGSFNPLTNDDWTEMAYVCNTARLCQAITDGELEHVEDWLAQEGSDPNCRDYTGRTPLQLATLCSTPAIVKCLIDNGARLVARLADGRTALHLAAARGNVEIVKLILQKSEQNEEEEAKKEDVRKQLRAAERKEASKSENSQLGVNEEILNSESDEDSDLEVVKSGEEGTEVPSNMTGSFVKIKPEKSEEIDIAPADEDEPDFYNVNVLAWDTACSPLHLTILNGHCDVVKELVQNFGADALLPIKLVNSWDKSPRGAILALVLGLWLPLESAKLITRTLLEVGASSAQGDMGQTTALHYIVGKEPDLLTTLFHYDEPAAARSINHLRVLGSQWSPSAQSPLMTAIIGRNEISTLKLLNAGAKPIVEFEDWMRSTQTKWEETARWDSKHNHENFLKNVEQPVVLAVQAEMPSVALELISRGADPSTLTSATQRFVTDEWSRRWNNDRPESLLDSVQKKIRELRKYSGEATVNPPQILLKAGEEYLENFVQDSYSYYVADRALIAQRESDLQAQKNYHRHLEAEKKRQGIAEKEEAIKALIVKFERLDGALLASGAKSFEQLRPDLAKEASDNNNNNQCFNDIKPEIFNVEFNFLTHDLTDQKKEAYVRLFEGAWSGDLALIKSLTLAPWAHNVQTPLQVAITDSDGHSPFNIAVLRGHWDVAKAILEIAQAQYSPEKTKTRERYNMGIADSDNEDSDLEGHAADWDVQVCKELIDDQYTIENIGELSTQVKSNISPHGFLNWRCPVHKYKAYFDKDPTSSYNTTSQKVGFSNGDTLVQYAILNDDSELFTYLLELEMEWTDRISKDAAFIPTFSQTDFEFAIECGRLPMLAQMISHTGAGMALDSLIKKSGVRLEEKPKYYQGLSVHGKKRTDWVSQARGTSMQIVHDKHPPVLQAASQGNLDSVEWFLSDTPVRHYKDFADANKSDKRIKHLNESAGGFDQVLSSWLGARRELIIHCAVLSKPSAQSTRLLKYLIDVVPESLHTKSSAGITPLALAFSLHRLAAARTLIAAGADQTARDHKGNNILHLLLCSPYTFNAFNSYKLQDFLNLIDRRLVTSVLTERSQEGAGASTPLARWIYHRFSNRYYSYGNDEDRQSLSTLRRILEFASITNNEHLELLDGSGDTPLHHVIKSQLPKTVELILERRPDLIHRENATGRTPAEMAEDAYIAHCVKDPPILPDANSPRNILHEDAASFGKDYEPKDDRPMPERIWSLCKRCMEKHPGKRRLVSLFEANEVAKRLATRQVSSRRARRVENDDEGDDGNYEDATDEVASWYHSNSAWREYESNDESEETVDDATSADNVW